MSKSVNIHSSSISYGSIAGIPMSVGEREDAVFALSLGEAVANMIVRILNGIDQLSSAIDRKAVAPKPALKHKLAV